MAAPKKVRWEKLETEYVTGAVSYADLCKKHHVSMSVVKAEARKREWVSKRKEYRSKVCQKAVQKSANNEAERLAKIGIVANQALDRVMKAFEDDKQFNRYIVSTSVGPGMSDMEERIYDKVDTKALRELTATIKDLTAIMRNVYGIPTQAEAEAQRIAAERLELDKQKIVDDTDSGVQVVIAGEVAEWAK